MKWDHAAQFECEPFVCRSLVCSIVVCNGLGVSLPLEVCGIVLLCVPAVVGMHNIVSPAHGLSVGNSVAKSAEVHIHIVECVLRTCAPAHEGWLMMAPATKVDRPARTISLVRWVAMQVLSLLHVDARDLVALFLGLPNARPDVRSSTSLHIELLALVEADALRVCFDIVELIARGWDAGALNGTVLQLLTVGWSSWWLRPDVQVKFLANDSDSFGLDARADSCDGVLADGRDFRYHR